MDIWTSFQQVRCTTTWSTQLPDGLTPERKAPRAIRAMRGKTLQTVPFKGISTVLWVHQKLPQSTVSQAFPSNQSYESKAGCNRTPATVLWAPAPRVAAMIELYLVQCGICRGFLVREEHSMDRCRSRRKLSENLERHWSIRISGEMHMDQWS